MRHERDALLGPFPLGNIVDNNNQMSRDSGGIAGNDAARREDTRLAFRHFDFIVVGAPADRTAPAASESDASIRSASCRLVDLEYGFPQNFVAADLEHRFKGPVHQHELARDGIFHDHGDRNVFND